MSSVPRKNHFKAGVLSTSGVEAVRSKGVLSTAGDQRVGVNPRTEMVHATEWRSDPSAPIPLGETVGFAPGGRDQRAYEAHDEDCAVFTSTPLAEPVEWTGMVRAELEVMSTGRDTDVVVRVCDVYPDGRSMLVVEYAQRARYREGFGKQVLMEPDEPTSIAFDIGWCSITFAAGHKIRVVVSSTGDPLYEANAHQDGSEMTVEPPPGGGPAVTNTLLHGGRCVSKIVAPVVPIG